MRKALPILSFSILTSSLFAQQDSLLRNFKFRIDHYRAITLQSDVTGQYNDYDTPGIDNRNSGTSGSLGAQWYSLKSTDRMWRNITASLSASFASSRSPFGTITDKIRNAAFSGGLDIQHRFYRRNFFFELGAGLVAGIQSYRYLTNSYKSNNHHETAGMKLGIGKGRLENITDMQNACWLNKALKSEGKLSRPLTTGELSQLGRMTMQANNTRVPDFRRKTQFILESVDRYLQDKGLISQTDIRYFSSLNDILFFAYNNARLSGTEKFIRLEPAISNLNLDQVPYSSTSKYEGNSTKRSVRLSIGFSRYRPVSLVHQDNYGVLAFASYADEDNHEKYFNSGVLAMETRSRPSVRKTGLNLFYRHEIFPNTRTIVGIGFVSEGGYQDFNVTSGFYGMAELSGSANYFISYRTRITGGVGVIYRNNVYELTMPPNYLARNFQAFINGGIVVSI